MMEMEKYVERVVLPKTSSEEEREEETVLSEDITCPLWGWEVDFEPHQETGLVKIFAFHPEKKAYRLQVVRGRMIVPGYPGFLISENNQSRLFQREEAEMIARRIDKLIAQLPRVHDYADQNLRSLYMAREEGL